MKISKLILLITSLLYYVKSIAISSKLKKEKSSSNTNEYLKNLNMMNINMEIYSNSFF